MHRLGVETTIFARSKRIGIFTSSKLQQLAQEELSKELNFYLRHYQPKLSLLLVALY